MIDPEEIAERAAVERAESIRRGLSKGPVNPNPPVPEDFPGEYDYLSADFFRHPVGAER